MLCNVPECLNKSTAYHVVFDVYSVLQYQDLCCDVIKSHSNKFGSNPLPSCCEDEAPSFGSTPVMVY